MADETQFSWLRFLIGFVRVTRWIIILSLGFGVGIFALYSLINSPFVNSVKLSEIAVFHYVILICEPVVTGLKSVIRVSTTFHEFDLLPLFIATAFYFVMNFARARGLQLLTKLETQDKIQRLKSVKTKTQSADGLNFSSTSTDKSGKGLLGGLGFKQEDERDKLLRELAEVKKRLEKSKQRLAFLSVEIGRAHV